MKTLAVKLSNPALNIIFALVSFVILLLLLNLVLSRYLPPAIYPTLCLIPAAVLSGFVAKYLSQTTGEIEMQPECVAVKLYNEYLNRDYLYTIPRHEINAFEIYKDKYFTKLIFYRHNKSPKTFTLATDQVQENELTAFLRTDLRYLDKKTKLSSQTLSEAFSRSLFNILIIAFGIITVYLTLNWLYYSANGKVISINILYWFLLTISFLLLYNKLHYKGGFRLVGRTATWVIVIFLSFVMYITLIPALYSIVQKPVKVHSLTDNTSDFNHKFLMPEEVLADTSQIGYAVKILNKRKSSVHTVTHYLTAPVLDPENRDELNHNWFIGCSYEQKIPKTLSNYEKDERRISFLNEKAALFKRAAVKTAKFYEVAYHQNNSAFKNNYFLRSALSTRHVIPDVVVVTPHEESFSEMRKAKINSMLLVCLVAFAALLVNALIIAFNR